MEKLIEDMLNNSILMSVVILLLLLLSTLLFKKNLAKWRYYTWLVVIVGLLIPFRPTFDIIPVRLELPVQFVTQNIIPVIGEQPELNGLQTNETENPSAPVSPENNTLRFYWPIVAVTVWVVGFLASLTYCFLKHRKFLKAVKRWSFDGGNENISTLLDDAKKELGIIKDLEVKTCKIVSTPVLIGFVKPVILLPPDDFEYDELELIIKHELTHYKRKDLWYKALVLFTNSVHWFNPFVYIMARAVTTDCEMSCDEAVLKDKDMQQRMLYGETVISIIKNQSSVSTVFSTGFKERKKIIEKRMFSIMDVNRKRMGAIIMVFALIGTLATGLLSVSANAENIDMSNQYSNYSQYGVSYRKKTDRLFYNGEPIRYFEDNAIIYNGDGSISGSIILYTAKNNDGKIDVHAIRDSNNKLTGVRIANQDEFASKTILAQSMDEAISIYKEFGLSANMVGQLYFEGLFVREIYDPVTGVLITESRGAAFPKDSIDIIATYDNSKLSGLKKVTQGEYDLRTQERIEAVQDYWIEQQTKK